MINIDWELVLLCATVSSVILFLASVIIVPWLVVTIPEDYFTNPIYHEHRWRDRHPIITIVFFITRNTFGGLLVIAGIVMLFVPGQGLLTILMGIALLDIPKKRQLLNKVIAFKPVINTINWVREKNHHPPLKMIKPK